MSKLVPLNTSIVLPVGALNARYRLGSNKYMKFDLLLPGYGAYVPLSTNDGYIRTRILTEEKVRAGEWRDAPSIIDLVSSHKATWSVDNTHFRCEIDGYTLRWVRGPEMVLKGDWMLDIPRPKSFGMVEISAERTNGCYARFVDPEQVLYDPTLGIFDEGASKNVTGFEIY